jgi:hypothetical protein
VALSGGTRFASDAGWPPGTVRRTLPKVMFSIGDSVRPDSVLVYPRSPGMSAGAVRFVPVMFLSVTLRILPAGGLPGQRERLPTCR